MYSSLVVAQSSDKHCGNILTVSQDLPAYVVMTIVANLNHSCISFVMFTEATTNKDVLRN